MDVSERFLKFAAECEQMAKFTPSPENELTWHRMAERWIRCAELFEKRDAATQSVGSVKRHRESRHNWAH
jgi:hypothetical protein